MGFFSRLFGKKKQEEEHVELHHEEKVDLTPYPQNKLVRFNDNSKWPGKFAIIISREERTEQQLRDVYKKDVPYFYNLAVETEGNSFLQLRMPVSHLKIRPAKEDELREFKQRHTSVKITKDLSAPTGNNELTNPSEVDEWNRMKGNELMNDDIKHHPEGCSCPECIV